jgi:N-acetylmuramoyl-L-alanine amidase CwlA
MTINKKQIAYNRTKRSQRPQHIVIHDTANKNKGANAEAHFNYFNNGDRQASADFFVDDKQILQVNDYNTYYTWHCGDGKGKNGITNANSIGIEICVNSDGNYDIAFQNAVALTKQLMAELNIPIDRVVRHYDASGKNCPASMSANNWALWNTFKVQLQSHIPWYNDAQWWVKANGISDGTRPEEPATRAEVWQMLYRLSKL